MLVELAEVQSVANPIECAMIPSESRCRGLLRILSAKANFFNFFSAGINSVDMKGFLLCQFHHINSLILLFKWKF